MREKGIYIGLILQDLKIRFYELMNQYYSHDNKYLDIFKSYREMYDTPKAQQNEQLWKKVKY